MKRTIVGRQGDVIVERVSAIPKTARRTDAKVLKTHSESGHPHQLMAAAVFNAGPEVDYVQIDEPTQMTHAQHPALDLAEGLYMVRHVRDFTPRRNLLD
jgi:hypothetical protein